MTIGYVILYLFRKMGFRISMLETDLNQIKILSIYTKIQIYKKMQKILNNLDSLILRICLSSQLQNSNNQNLKINDIISETCFYYLLYNNFKNETDKKLPLFWSWRKISKIQLKLRFRQFKNCYTNWNILVSSWKFIRYLLSTSIKQVIFSFQNIKLSTWNADKNHNKKFKLAWMYQTSN